MQKLVLEQGARLRTCSAPLYPRQRFAAPRQIPERRSPSGCSGMVLSQSRLMLYWLLTLDVRLPNGCSGIVPMTSGSSRSSLDVPGISTQTCRDRRQEGNLAVGVFPIQRGGSFFPRAPAQAGQKGILVVGCKGRSPEQALIPCMPWGGARGEPETSHKSPAPKCSAAAQSGHDEHSSGETGSTTKS